MNKRITIAIDGPAGAGKSTTARRVAHHLGYAYIDTGAMYRAVTLAAIHMLGDGVKATADHIHELMHRISIDLLPSDNGQRTFLNGEDVTEALRDANVTDMVSHVSAMHEVREALVSKQRGLGSGGGVVMDGRDIGSVVFPNAEVKVFLIADVDERARRRSAELEARGIHTTPEDVRRQIIERDAFDSSRAESPLVKPSGATEIDTTSMTVDDQVARILALVDSYHRTYNLISTYGRI